VSAVDEGRSSRLTVLLVYPAIFFLFLERFQKALSSGKPKIATANSPTDCQGAAEGYGRSSTRRCEHASKKKKEDYGSSKDQSNGRQ
jgi:hypothetical protein